MITAVAILGPTASGKSSLGMALARAQDGEILSIDSRQVYRRLDIGTAKPSPEERRAVRHHLIDILDLHEKCNAEAFARAALDALRDAASRGKLPILVGGSGLYFRAIAQGFFAIALDRDRRAAFAESLRGFSEADLHARLAAIDPESARRIHRNDRYRIVRALEVHELTGTTMSEHRLGSRLDPERAGIRFIKIGLAPARFELHRSIEERTRGMFARGWVEEVRGLLEAGADPAWPGMRTLGYPQVVDLISGRRGAVETERRVIELTRQYAKRQVTWFRKEADIHWLDGGGPRSLETALALLEAPPPGPDERR